MLKIRTLFLDACVYVCRAAESAISLRPILDGVCEPVHVVSHGRLLMRECRYRGRPSRSAERNVPEHGKTCNKCGVGDNFEPKCMKGRNTNQLSRNQYQRREYNIRDNNGSDEDDDSGDAWVHSLTPQKLCAYANCRMLVYGKQLVKSTQVPQSIRCQPDTPEMFPHTMAFSQCGTRR